MRRPDVTAAFVLASSIAILASEQEHHEHPELLPPGTAHLAGYGFIGTITALVAAGRLDLPTGVRLAVSSISFSSNAVCGATVLVGTICLGLGALGCIASID